METLPNQTARDNAGHVLSISFKVISHPATTKYSSGQIAFLPPCKDISTEEAINDIIEVFKKKESKETPPEWTSLIDLPGLKNVNDEIAQLNSTKASIEAQISTSQMKKETLEAHSRLLYATGTALEDSVYNAFKLIGLDDITRLREKNKEDWVFKFQTANEFEYGIIEVKGVDARTTLGHLTQTNKWTDEYFENNKKVSKAIFVPNQHRSAKYPDSKEKRIHFEPNELEYARMKHVCILPSCVIFEAVHEHLEGKIRTRAEMEKKIAQASGLITDL